MRKTYKKIKSESLAKAHRRKLSIRSKVVGTTERPRICAIKSNKHLVVQVVDDSQNKTLFSVQTFGKSAVKAHANIEGAKVVGKEVSDLLQKHNVNTAVFDRNGQKYIGVIAALADSIRENGIKI